MASKSNTVREVREFARRHGIAISPKAGNSPLMGKGDWMQDFDSWKQAHEYFKKWQWHKVDNNLPFPWDSKINQQIDALNMRSKNPAKSSTKRVALFAANPAPRKGAGLFGIRVNAGNDRSGNPQRGWIVMKLTAGDLQRIEFVNEGFSGRKSLTNRHGDIPTVGDFAIGATEYKALKKSGFDGE